MKSRMWCIFCAILMSVVSIGALADTHWDPSGGGSAWGGGYGNGWGDSCSASASANSAHPDQGAVYWASVYAWTDQAGYFMISWDCWASGSASYTDQNGSGASGSGGGSGSTYGGGASAGISLSSGGTVSSDANGVYDPGYAGMLTEEEAVWLSAFSGVSASSSCGAYASIGNHPNSASGAGNAYAYTALTRKP
jgi:hypothetical protein